MTDSDRDEFMRGAKPVQLQLEDGTTCTVMPKRFSTGSVGWYANLRLTIHGVPCQVGITFTIVGSKPDWLPYKERHLNKTSDPGNEPETPQKLFEQQNGSKPSGRAPKRS